MTIHTCKKCGKHWKLKGDYTRHINRKISCDNKTIEEKIKNIVKDEVKNELAKLNIKDNTINAMMKCTICDGEFPEGKHHPYCYSLDPDWDLKQMKPQIDYIDLFCGTGGFSEAFKPLPKINCVYANDMVSSSKKIYELNHEKDIFELKNLNSVKIDNIPDHNMICGGFPCQPFSIAGKRLGFQDPRANVFWTIMRIIEKNEPDILMFENVKNLMTHGDGNTFNTIKKALTDKGYYIKYKVLDTCKITGIPHHRERIYIVGFKDKNVYDGFKFDFPIVGLNPISNYIEPNTPDKYYYTDRYKDFKKIETAVIKHINTNTLYQYRRHYVRENKNNLCPTLTANMGGGGHNVPLLKDDKGIRKLTPRECFNLQGFPRDYILPILSDSALYTLAGNAITVPVANLIITKIEQLL